MHIFIHKERDQLDQWIGQALSISHETNRKVEQRAQQSVATPIPSPYTRLHEHDMEQLPDAVVAITRRRRRGRPRR
jgi:hypothetical protein